MNRLILLSVSRNSLRLGIFALFTVGLVALTWFVTQDRIAEQIKTSERKALLEVLPHERFDNRLLETTVTLPDAALLGPLPTGTTGWVAFLNGKPSAVILPAVAPDGYNGRIQMLVAIDVYGKLTGVRVVAHKETPGLGDSIEIRVSDWIKSFTGKSLQNPEPALWGVKKDGGSFDQFTGATITPRAVTAAVYRALQYFDQQRTTLFERGLKSIEKQENDNG